MEELRVFIQEVCSGTLLAAVIKKAFITPTLNEYVGRDELYRTFEAFVTLNSPKLCQERNFPSVPKTLRVDFNAGVIQCRVRFWRRTCRGNENPQPGLGCPKFII